VIETHSLTRPGGPRPPEVRIRLILDDITRSGGLAAPTIRSSAPSNSMEEES